MYGFPLIHRIALWHNEDPLSKKASFSQLHVRAALEDLGISISFPDIPAGVAWRETFR